MKYKIPIGITYAFIALLFVSVGLSSLRSTTESPLSAPINGDAVNQSDYAIRYTSIRDTPISTSDSTDTLNYSTFLGGGYADYAFAITIDENKSIYVTGRTASPNFPTTIGAYNRTYGGSDEGFVVKFSSNGQILEFSTFLGGGGSDAPSGIIYNNNSVYVVGTTRSLDFPTTTGAFDQSHNGGLEDVFLSVLSADGSSLQYSTFLGGSEMEQAEEVAINGSDGVYIVGRTASGDFPTTIGAYNETKATPGVYYGGFMSKIVPNGNGVADLVYSTFLEGSIGENSRLWSVEVDTDNDIAYLVGETDDSSFPTTTGAYNETFGGNSDGFFAKLAPIGGGTNDLTYSSFIGGGYQDIVRDLDLSSPNTIYITGQTASPGFPTTLGAYNTTHSNPDTHEWEAFVTKLILSGGGGNDLIYSTFLGGAGNDNGEEIEVDEFGVSYIIGGTSSPYFPVLIGSYNTTYGGAGDAFLSILNPDGSDLYNSTYLGGGANDVGTGLALDEDRYSYISIYTQSIGFPTTGDAYNSTHSGSVDIAYSKLNAPILAEIDIAILSVSGSLDLSESFEIFANVSVPTYAIYGLNDVDIYFGGTIYDMTNETTGDFWNWTWTKSMTISGLISYYIYAETTNGGYNQSETFNTYVGYPPSISNIDPNTGDRDNMTQGLTFVVDCTVTDSRTGDTGVSAVHIDFDGEYYAMSADGSTYTFKKVINTTGTYEWRIRARDNVGNIVFSDWYSVIVEAYEGTSGDPDRDSISALRVAAQELEAETGAWSIALVAIVTGLLVVTMLLKSKSYGYLPGIGIAIGLMLGLLLGGPYEYWQSLVIGLYLIPWMFFTHKKGFSGLFAGLVGAFAGLMVYSIIYNGIESLATWAFISMLAGSVGAYLLPGRWRFLSLGVGLTLGIVFLVLL